MEQVPDDIRADNPDSSQNAVSAARSVRLADRVLAQGTRDTYRCAVQRFERWLGNRTPDDAALSDYLNELFERGLAPATASVVVAALVDRARWGGTSSPYGKRTALTLTGFRRSGKRGRGQVVGINWREADRAASLAERSGKVSGLRDALLIRIASDRLLRMSEVSALDSTDISFIDDWLLVIIRQSKTDRESAGATLYAGSPTAAIARRWLEVADIREGPLFRPINKGGVVSSNRLGTRTMREVVKRWAAKAEIEGRVSGHSLRVGTAQSLRDAGATTAELMVAGRWKRVETMAGYIRTQDAASGPVARLRYGAIPLDGRTDGGVRRIRVETDEVHRHRFPPRVKARRKAIEHVKRLAKKLKKAVAQLEAAVIRP